jgi:hypothetical protein
VATAKQRATARRNVKKAQAAPARKRTIADLSELIHAIRAARG